MKGCTAAYNDDTTRFRTGEEMEGSFRLANIMVLRKRETTAR